MGATLIIRASMPFQPFDDNGCSEPVFAIANEIRTLAPELHDQVGQVLTALRMDVRAMSELRDSGTGEFDHS